MNNTRISISKNDLENAAREGSMSPLDVEPLWQALSKSQARLASSTNPGVVSVGSAASGFDLAQLFWYGGGTLIMIALGFFMALAQSSYGSGATFGLSILYSVGFALLGDRLLKQGARAPAGVLFTVAVLLVPLAADAGMSLMQVFGYAHAQAHAVTLELLTVGVALLALMRARTSILTAPIYGTLWLLSLTLAWIFTSSSDGGFLGFFSDYNHYNVVSMVTGLVLLLSAVVVDSRFGRGLAGQGNDYSWWGYLFGVAAFWIPLSLLDSGGELGKFIYFLINLLLMVSSVVLARRVLLLFGAVGSIYYVGHILGNFLSNSFSLSLALIALGVGIIYLGIQYRKHQASVEAAILGCVPDGLRRVLPRRR